ncbi:unnamed protein product [Prunus armeniaca]|uniref:Uncharacterized protein n=1 Tax=Prunus armeniaca TaxID=36596 RepID=A0A6J5TX38_PRUAR|nr:unnamed protein product [Prunus armeniaca]
MASRTLRPAVGINTKSSTTHSTIINGCETSVAYHVQSSHIGEASSKVERDPLCLNHVAPRGVVDESAISPSHT